MMASYLNLDGTECLKAKIDEKAHDLFKPKPGKPQLQVSRLFKTRTAEGKETTRFVRNQDVGDVSQIKAMEHVREHTCPISTTARYIFQL
jgi:hypothetical protein